jgi:hypothetical protein
LSVPGVAGKLGENRLDEASRAWEARWIDLAREGAAERLENAELVSDCLDEARELSQVIDRDLAAVARA